jgi:hypothetical protein
MTLDEPWLAAVWPFVRDQLPPARASVVEVGCGPAGGFVPALVDRGYDAVGVDPEAPEGPDYRRIEFERYEPPQPLECVVASLSLHHVADLGKVLDRLDALLVPGGVLVVEWAWEWFDEATARWCFARLKPPAPGAEPGWLHKHQERWMASGQPWDDYCRTWAEQEGLHPGEEIVQGAGCAVYPSVPYRGAVLLCRPGRHQRGPRAGRDRGWSDPGGRYPVRRHPRLTSPVPPGWGAVRVMEPLAGARSPGQRRADRPSLRWWTTGRSGSGLVGCCFGEQF